MQDRDKTKKQLIDELKSLRKEVADFKKQKHQSIINESICNEAEKLANIGSWIWNIKNDNFTFSTQWQSI